MKLRLPRLFARPDTRTLHEIITSQQDPELGRSLQAFVRSRLRKFKSVLASCPGSALGGVSVAEAFWLYNLVQALKPRQVIESGTFYGYSLYFIRAAVKWPCRILSFDVDQSKSHRHQGVEYRESDWMDCEDIAQGEGTLIFFDDHIDQDRRLAEAIRRNQQHVLFHDNYLTVRQSHRPIRFCSLEDAIYSYTFPALYCDRIFTDTRKNLQTYRWLTYIQRPTGGGS